MNLFRQHDSSDRRAAFQNVKPIGQRRFSAPSLVLSKALTRTKASESSECVSDFSPASCALVQSLLGPRRKLVFHGVVRLQAGLQTQERYLFLFNDIFIISKLKSCSQVKQKMCVRVSEMWTASCLDEVCEGTTSPDMSFVIGWPTHNCVATFRTAYQKERWLSLLESCIQEQKEHDNPKAIPLKIYAKDTGNCAYAKTLLVRNTHTTSVVITAALQQFGLQGSLKDFQLWVSSSKDEAPYPLIGHEFPYSIKMSHIRALQRDGETRLDPQVALLSEDTQCQIILRPQPAKPTHTLADEQRSKRKLQLLSWPFRRSSSAELDGQLQSSPHSAPGCLFGRPLSDVIIDHTLPSPIKDMLVCLCNEGSATCGIFRRSAGIKACRELRMKLDSDDCNISLKEESAFVTAAVFKEFLRNIPGSLMCEDLHDQWLKVMECKAGRGKESSIQAAQRLVQLLPKEHHLLLRHVISMLHCVQSHADLNQMSSSNLAVCIAPSLLWSKSLLPQQEDTMKVCDLVQFLIDNCHSVFGNELTSITDLPLDSNLSSAGSLHDESDLCNLNAEPEDTSSTHLLKDQTLSKDSLISLSDCDLDADPLPALPLALIKTFTPTVRQPRPHILRRCSEPALTRHSPTSLGMGTEVRKARLDSDTSQEDSVFLEHGFQNMKLTLSACRVRQLNEDELQQDISSSSSSSLLSSATSSSSVSSMDISSDTIFSQSGECSSPCPESLPSSQESPPKRQFDELSLENLSGLQPDTWSSGNFPASVCVKHLSCRASQPPSYPEALMYLNRSPSTQVPTNTPPKQTLIHTSPILSLHEPKNLFYRGPAACLAVEPQIPLSPQATSSNTSETYQRSGSLDLQPDGEVLLPQSLFFGQSCQLTMQKSRLQYQATIPTLPDHLSGRVERLDSYNSSSENDQTCFIKVASNRLGTVNGLRDVTQLLDQCSGGLYSSQCSERLAHGFQTEESYV